MDDLKRSESKEPPSSRERIIGILIGVFAVLLAVCGLGGSNAVQTAMLKNIEASNTWAFFQAKNARRQMIRLQRDEFTVLLAAEPALAPDVKKLVEGKIAGFDEQDKHLSSDKEKMEGLDELFAKAKASEAERDDALKRGPYFDYGQALLQIAIVLASVAIIAGTSLPLIASIVVAALGAMATFGGFTLAFPLPFAA